MKDVKILISSLLIFVSFFVWYYFWNYHSFYDQENIDKDSYKVLIDTDKENMNVTNENIKIFLNWELLDK